MTLLLTPHPQNQPRTLSPCRLQIPLDSSLHLRKELMADFLAHIT